VVSGRYCRTSPRADEDKRDDMAWRGRAWVPGPRRDVFRIAGTGFTQRQSSGVTRSRGTLVVTALKRPAGTMSRWLSAGSTEGGGKCWAGKLRPGDTAWSDGGGGDCHGRCVRANSRRPFPCHRPPMAGEALRPIRQGGTTFHLDLTIHGCHVTRSLLCWALKRTLDKPDQIAGFGF
jgi:hypothetical protein